MAATRSDFDGLRNGALGLGFGTYHVRRRGVAGPEGDRCRDGQEDGRRQE